MIYVKIPKYRTDPAMYTIGWIAVSVWDDAQVRYRSLVSCRTQSLADEYIERLIQGEENQL